MLFFQGVLLLGYAYAHGLTTWLQPKRQRTAHIFLLLFSLALILSLRIAWKSPLLPNVAWKPINNSQPVGRLLCLLTVSVGLPFFVLSSTGPLLQRWSSRTHPIRRTYRLYALSNLGSLVALIGYPLFLEPSLSLSLQAICWAAGYLLFAGLCASCACRSVLSPLGGEGLLVDPAVDSCPETKNFDPSWSDFSLWLGLPLGTSLLLLAITNQICQEVAVVPFLWVAPLGLYLLSFILTFESDRIYQRGVFLPLMASAVSLVCLLLYEGVQVQIATQVLVYCLALFFCCMVLHGELSRLKPAARHLTTFYVIIATGGALGGVFAGLAAPLLFKGFDELPLGLWLCCALVILVLLRDRNSWVYRRHPWPGLFFLLPLAGMMVYYWNLGWLETALTVTFNACAAEVGRIAVVVILAGVLTFLLWKNWQRLNNSKVTVSCLTVWLFLLGWLFYLRIQNSLEDCIWRKRNFYGVLVVLSENSATPLDHFLRLRHGRVSHGLQYQDPVKSRLPTTYYGLNSGVGLALQLHPRRFADSPRDRNLRIGVVGLGVGTLASYAKPGDYVRIYEINPDVIRLSLGNPAFFSYLKNCLGKVEVIPGDARLSMEKEILEGQPQEFDLLAVDAFSSDAIPVHLMTREALQLYLRHLRMPDGVLAIHITNRYLDLRPVVWNLSSNLGLQAVSIYSDPVGELAWSSHWMLLSPNSSLLSRPEIQAAKTAVFARDVGARPWTDDYSNLLKAVKW